MMSSPETFSPQLLIAGQKLACARVCGGVVKSALDGTPQSHDSDTMFVFKRRKRGTRTLDAHNQRVVHLRKRQLPIAPLCCKQNSCIPPITVPTLPVLSLGKLTFSCGVCYRSDDEQARTCVNITSSPVKVRENFFFKRRV